MKWLRDLVDRIFRRRPQEPERTREQEYEDERKRELLRKHDERMERGDDDKDRLIDV